MQVYQLVVLGNADSSELANTDAPQMMVDPLTGVVRLSDPPEAPNLYIVRFMLIFVSFVIGVSLMNLFLAMLCLTYSNAHDAAHLSFLRSQLNLVLDQHAVRVGTARLFFCSRRRRHNTEKLIYRHSAGDLGITKSGAVVRASADAFRHDKQAFLWFAKQAKQ